MGSFEAFLSETRQDPLASIEIRYRFRIASNFSLLTCRGGLLRKCFLRKINLLDSSASKKADVRPHFGLLKARSMRF